MKCICGFKEKKEGKKFYKLDIKQENSENYNTVYYSRHTEVDLLVCPECDTVKIKVDK